MLQRIADLLSERTGAELVGIVRVEQDPGRFVCEAVKATLPTDVRVGYGRELGSGVVGEVGLTGQAILLDDVSRSSNFVETMPGTRSEICVPVRHAGEVVAVLNLESTRPAFFAGQLPFYEAVADVIAGAIAGARLLAALRERSRELELLSEVFRLGFGGERLEEVLASIAERVRSRFDLVLVAVVVADEAGEEWVDRAMAVEGGLPELVRLRWPVSAGVVGRAIREGRPTLVLDVRQDPDYLLFDSRVRCEYVVPFRLKERILGALNLESESPAVFTKENLALFRALAEQLVAPIELARVNRDLERANRELERLSRTDALTGLANRRAFDEALEREWRRACRAGSSVAVILLDVDHFKAYNDSLGHPAGDRALAALGSMLAEEARRAEDVVARYGGEEMVLLLPGLELADAAAFAEHLLERARALGLEHAASPSGRLTLSAGVAALVPVEGRDAGLLVDCADSALYRAKQEGRDRVCLAQPQERD